MVYDIVIDYKFHSLKMSGGLKMMIKLKNAATGYTGKAILINTAHILTVFEAELNGVATTHIYSTTKETWQVQETITQVLKLINKDANT